MPGKSADTRVKVADEVWIATALLHREHPERPDFTVKEIEERARDEAVNGEARKGIYPHALLHCVANTPPNPGRYRMLFATGRTRRRLFRPGDAYDPKREGSKIMPSRDEIPAKYHYLLEWYESEWGRRAEGRGGGATEDPILGLRGAGKDVWEGEDPDAYVARLREGWQ